MNDELIAQIRAFLADAPQGKPYTRYRYGELLQQAADALAEQKEIHISFCSQVRDKMQVVKQRVSDVEQEFNLALSRIADLERAHNTVDGQYSRVLHEMAGAVSMCWIPKPLGEFDSTNAIEFVSTAIGELRAIYNAAMAEEKA